MLLLALRLRDVEQRLELFRDSGIDVHVLQVDALALHNFLCYDRLSASGSDEQTSGGVVAVDVGCEATGVLFSFPDFVWFRAARPAGDDFAARLVRRFKITSEMAERVKRDPTKVKQMSDLYEELCIVYRNIVAHFESAQTDFQKGCARQIGSGNGACRRGSTDSWIAPLLAFRPLIGGASEWK